MTCMHLLWMNLVWPRRLGVSEYSLTPHPKWYKSLQRWTHPGSLVHLLFRWIWWRMGLVINVLDTSVNKILVNKYKISLFIWNCGNAYVYHTLWHSLLWLEHIWYPYIRTCHNQRLWWCCREAAKRRLCYSQLFFSFGQLAPFPQHST